MSTQVEASTVNAGQLFSNSTFYIPDFQRPYSWKVKEQVEDFWRDLSTADDGVPYFLGLLILTQERSNRAEKTVVDGQQRLVTLALLASAIRQSALARNKLLVADSMRDMFLLGLDYETEKRHLKVNFDAEDDRSTFESIVYGTPSPATATPNREMLAAYKFLCEQLESELGGDGQEAGLARWAKLLSNGLIFAQFDHPSRNEAYKVYEVVNTRGLDLTPADLIKGHVFGVANAASDQSVGARWRGLEDAFRQINAQSQFTQFIRHVVTLNFGYVLPRDLYQVIVRKYGDHPGALALLSQLEDQVDLYLRFIDPTYDSDTPDDIVSSFAILDALSLTTVRPIFMAVASLQEHSDALRTLVGLVITRITVGSFGTGAVEKRFADAAHNVFVSASWEHQLSELASLKPEQVDFENAVCQPQAKGVLHVLRLAAIQGTELPVIEGHLHQVRAKNAENWPEFPNDDFKLVGSTVGNYFVSLNERRPRGTNTPEAVRNRLVTTAIQDELISPSDFPWTGDSVRASNSRITQLVSGLWYGA